MGRIKDTNKYPYDLSINPLDYLIGSDADNNGQTKNFRLDDLGNFFAQYFSAQSDSTYYFVQETALTVWEINHNMNKYPTPLVRDTSGEVILTNIVYINKNVLQVRFGTPMTGSVTLN